MLRGSTKLTACDLSPNMVAIARGKLPETVDVLEAMDRSLSEGGRPITLEGASR